MQIFLTGCICFLIGQLVGGLFVIMIYKLKEELRGFEWETEE